MRGDFTEYKPVPAESNFNCRKCGSADLKYRVWDSSDGAYTDYNYHCDGCGRDWWVEGADT